MIYYKQDQKYMESPQICPFLGLISNRINLQTSTKIFYLLQLIYDFENCISCKIVASVLATSPVVPAVYFMAFKRE